MSLDSHNSSSPTGLPSSTFRLPCLGPALRAYFSNGWAFLIPYLLTYLLYAWRKWPANPAGTTRVQTSAVSDQLLLIHGPSSLVPCLLYVYWALHALNLALAALALRSWWSKAKRQELSAKCETSENEALSADRKIDDGAPLGSSLLALRRSAAAVAPWLLLTLIFSLPGVYLEWPSDPWEHLRRITEWATHPLVANHSAGYKSFYFFAYSWVSWLSPAHLLSWLNVYYVGVCLLLAWQYYLLAKAVGLDRRWAFFSVIVNVLTFGNVCFSFYRYYALASTIFAQIGAVALTRIALEYAKSIGRSDGRQSTVDGSAEQPRVSGENQESRALPRRFWKAIPPFCARSALYSLLATRYSLLRSAAAGAVLLLLIAFNHIQGIGIAGLGFAAVIIWRLIEWKRPIILWLGAIAVVLSIATVLWWPRQPQVDSYFRPGGWLNVWYGFNLFAWPSPAADRMMQILGLFGLLNLVAAVILIRRNHIVGWLTLTPVLALSLPFVAIPFANSIATGIIVYHRMFFAIPCALAFIGCIDRQHTRWPFWTNIKAQKQCFLIVTVAAAVAILLSPQGPYHERSWNALSVTPADLQLNTITNGATSIAAKTQIHRNRRLIDTPQLASILNIIEPRSFPFEPRLIGTAMTESFTKATALALLGGNSINPQRKTLTEDPLAANPSAWMVINGTGDDFVAIYDFPTIHSALQTPPGVPLHVFTSKLLLIDQTQQYQIEISLRQSAGPTTISYLAVAWYDARGNLLKSNSPAPSGAGKPTGWNNGFYSYFGIAGEQTPREWTTYWKSFGPGSNASIPSTAKFVRLGALLNYGAAPAAIVQLTNVRLWQKSKRNPIADGIRSINDRDFILVPSATSLTTYASQTALATHHWPPNQVGADLAAGPQMTAAGRSASARLIGGDSSTFQLYKTPNVVH